MNARSQLIAPRILEIGAVDGRLRREMYALYERYYAGTSAELFASDLAGKDYVLLLHDEIGMLQGFSTMAVYAREFEGRTVRALFSGDTVVDEKHWGQQALAQAWLRFAGGLQAENPELPLYWLLISKGHRTYRYLSAFSREFHPAPGLPVPDETRALMDFLALDRFGSAYDAGAGVLRFPEPRGHLRENYADVSEPHRRLAEVEFFLERNPGYASGDELVCLCRLAPENLQPIARRAFMAGARAGI